MSIVTRGLGGGSLVAGGLGFDEEAPPGELAALITGTGTVTATLSSTSGEPPADTPSGGGGGRNWFPSSRQPVAVTPPPRVFVNASALLTGSASVTASAEVVEHALTGFDDLRLLFALELV